MDPAASIGMIAGCASTIGVIIGVRRYLDRRPARAALARAAPLGPESAEGAFVRVTGIVRATSGMVQGPLTARACVIGRARIRNGIFGTPYETFSTVQFGIEVDATRVARIDGPYALLDVPRCRMRRKAMHPGRYDELLREHGLEEGVRNSFYLEESTVEPGMHVSVAGVLMKDPAASPDNQERGYREAPHEVRLCGTVEQPLAISCTPVHVVLAG